ncbi:arf-GAP with SH3 domain, ANK repeat and PH domain-containing protein 2-like [Babylonia areolata]|uniref:arf-GAP with SH3 domain, ANK repeat and PH domain-containing protein 2-like n=1 Tax=Babylonia areolata TaxID=304850 RepID=UPI003FD52A00
MTDVSEFIRETWEDVKSPTTSTFALKMATCRHTIGVLEENLDMDRSGLTKMKKSVKAVYNAGNMHVTNDSGLAENLERLGNLAETHEQEPELSQAFIKFSHVTKELASLMKQLMEGLNNRVLYPLDALVKGDLKGAKGDLKKPFDKAWKDYEAKFSKIEKEKKQQAEKAGMVRTEISGAEIADEMEKERKIFQLQMCEYLIKVNEIKTKKGSDLLQNLAEYYQAQAHFFQDGLKTLNHFQGFVEGLLSQLVKIKQRQEQERKQLLELRDALKGSMTSYKEHAYHRLSGGGWPPHSGNATPAGYSLHQLQGNKAHGNEKRGFLLKKSESRMRRTWQRRRCVIGEGSMYIYHQDESKDPVKLNLLTCQVKLVPDDPGKKCFDLVSSSNNRTYHFQAEDARDMEEWISVLNNAKEEVLLKAFRDTSDSHSLNQSVRELTSSIVDRIRRLPGNKYCCDCGAPDPEWLSTNLGVMICLECCGIHRELGVHISRTQSVVIDALGTSQLLLARVVGNSALNDIMEARLDNKQKPHPGSPMEERRDFIRAKYEHHRFAIITCTDKEDLKEDLKQAVLSKDLLALLQVYAEGLDLAATLPDMENGETALHLAILEDDGSSLPLVDFLIQNSSIGSLDKKTHDGNTVLHLCAQLNKTECMKLMLRTRPDLANIENKAGKTPLEIAREAGHQLCTELLKSAIAGKKDLFVHVNIDWDLVSEERFYDCNDLSDDDLDGTPDKPRSRSRPSSLIVMPPTDSPAHAQLMGKDRLHDDNGRLPPPPPPLSNKPKKQVAVGSKLRHSSNKLSYSVPGFNAPPIGGGPTTTATTTTTGAAAPPGQNGRNSPTSAPPTAVHGHAPYADANPHPPVTGAKPVLPPLPPRCKKPPPPPPPVTSGHVRNRSEPDASHLIHKRTGSEPPPHPTSLSEFRNTKSMMPPATAIGFAGAVAQGDRNGPGRTFKRSTSTQEERPRSDSQPEISHTAFPVPPQRTKMKKGRRRCKALYDCEADNDDELTFKEGEIIIILEEVEEEWWEGEVENNPKRRGLFPTSFVEMLND